MSAALAAGFICSRPRCTQLQSGSFTLDFYDPSGNVLFEVAGNVTEECISVE
jgi:hypothetical protein